MTIDQPGSTNGGAGSEPSLQSQAKQDLHNVTDAAKKDLDAVGQRAADDVRELGHQAGEKAAEVADKAKSFAADQKDLAASQINGVAAAITKVADELASTDQAAVAKYARDLASGLSGMGKKIESNDVDDLMGMAQDFGRSQPVAFLGAAALAGFVASRFALASAHRRDNKSEQPVSRSTAPSSGNSADQQDYKTGGL